jgi:hypothetical protein
MIGFAARPGTGVEPTCPIRRAPSCPGFLDHQTDLALLPATGARMIRQGRLVFRFRRHFDFAVSGL